MSTFLFCYQLERAHSGRVVKLVIEFFRPNVHINDTSVSSAHLQRLVTQSPKADLKFKQELFVKVYEYSVSGKKGNHGTSGYYFAESGEYTQ